MSSKPEMAFTGNMMFDMIAFRCLAPILEPEVKPKRWKRKRLPMTRLRPQPMMMFCISPSGEVDEAGYGDVVATDQYSGEGTYIIDWNGSAVVVSCRSIVRSPLISVQSGKLLATWVKEELEPYILGRVVGPVSRPEIA